MVVGEQGQDVVSKAKALITQGRHQQAIELLAPWLAENSDDASAWAALGAAHFEVENWTEAQKAAREVVRLRPDSAREWCNLGTILRKLGNVQEANEAQEQALELDPSYRRATQEVNKLRQIEAAEEASGRSTRVEQERPATGLAGDARRPAGRRARHQPTGFDMRKNLSLAALLAILAGGGVVAWLAIALSQPSIRDFAAKLQRADRAYPDPQGYTEADKVGVYVERIRKLQELTGSSPQEIAEVTPEAKQGLSRDNDMSCFQFMSAVITFSGSATPQGGWEDYEQAADAFVKFLEPGVRPSVGGAIQAPQQAQEMPEEAVQRGPSRSAPARTRTAPTSGNVAVGSPMPRQPQAQTVYVAPHEGQKWHADRNCRGLRNARAVVAMTRTEAEQRGYEPCGICAR